MRSATDSRQRRAALNPPSDWVTNPDESLRIVSDELWNAVRQRQDAQLKRIGERIAQGIERSDAKRTGRHGRYVLSGLLKCSECGSNYVMVNRRAHACSGYTNGRVRANGLHVGRDLVESRLLANIRQQLLDPTGIDEMVRLVRHALKSTPRSAHARQMAKLRHEIDHLIAAIGQGLLSSALRERLTQAEVELERLHQAPKPMDMERLLPGLPAAFRRKVEEIDRLAEREPARAHQVIKTALQAESIRLWPSADGRHLRTEYEIEPVGAATGSVSICVVAGAGFEPATFGL